MICQAFFTARQIVHWPIYKLNSSVNSNRDTGVEVWDRKHAEIVNFTTDQSSHSIGVGNMCQRAHDQRQSAATHPPVNLTFFISVLHLQKYRYKLWVRIVVSAIAVFRLVHNLRLFVHPTNLRLFTHQITVSALLPSQNVTPVCYTFYLPNRQWSSVKIGKSNVH